MTFGERRRGGGSEVLSARSTIAWFGGWGPSPERRPRPGEASEPDGWDDARWPIPIGGRILHTDPPLWVCGVIPARVAFAGRFCAAVFGSCAIDDAELARLAADDLSDRHITAWAGGYTLVRTTPDSVTVFTDPAGAQPIYTAAVSVPGPRRVWGSSSRALAGVVGAAPDPDWLRRRLLAEPDDHGKAEPGTDLRTVIESAGVRSASNSAFRGVVRQPAASRIDLRTGVVDARTAWTPDPSSTAPAAADRLRDALTDGIRLRVEATDDPVSADCSGGLDSAVTCLVAFSAAPSRVTAVNSQPTDRGTGGDLDYVAAIDAAYPTLRRRRVLLDDRHLPYRAMDRLPPTDQPPRSVTVAGRLAASCGVLRDLRSRTHLSGDGADQLLVGGSEYVLQLAGAGHPLRAWRHLRSWSRWQRSPAWRLALRARARDPIADRLAAVRAIALPAASDRQLTAGYGYLPGYTTPYLDNRVVDSALSTPAWRYAAPDAYKPLLVRAFADLLPPAVAGRRTKGTFLPDFYRGIRAGLPELTALADGELAAAGLIDPTEVRTLLRTAATGVGVDLERLELVLGTEAWLRAVRAAPPVGWATLPVGVEGVR